LPGAVFGGAFWGAHENLSSLPHPQAAALPKRFKARRGQPQAPRRSLHLFSEARAEAAKTMPSVKTLRDQDLRDTAVTWLARAGCTIMEVVQITGHSLASATQVLRHYLSQHREVGDNAMAKMIAWWDEQEQPSKAAD
jgi:integrase